MTVLSIKKILFYFLLMSVILQDYGVRSLGRKLTSQVKLFFSRINLPHKRTEIENVNFPSMENCERIDVLPDKYKATGGVPDLGEIVLQLGYPIEKYIVETEDGYRLTLFRIKHGKEGLDGTLRRPVMLQHGILDSSAAFLATPTGMAYYLADNGYDVWIGNSRGTMLSRDHRDEEKDPNKKNTVFWDFSFHEMGVHDLPAVIDKIREMTDYKQRIHYVGMSMGTTQFLVMASEKSEYLEYIGDVVLMAPVARPKHMSLATGINYVISWFFFSMMHVLTNRELCIYREQVAKALYKFCITKGIRHKICKKIMMNLKKPKNGENLYDFENTVGVYLYAPAGTSVQCFLHYLQIVDSGKFQQFDYGKEKNMDKYKQEDPPEYKLSKITKKMYLIVGGADDIAVEEDVLWLKNQLPSAEVITENFEYFTHRDFHHSINIQDILYPTILEKFSKWESENKS